MSNLKIKVDNVSKTYLKYKREWQRIASWFGLPFSPLEESKVLQNISFELNSGEAIGIIGQNGAGKSTLLKIITGTVIPSSGSMHVNGRIAAILELGMGFNPDITGRENVFLSAGLMGVSDEETDSLIPSIQSFSELGEYFEKPLRSYSSGMQMRLAFSIVTATRPDVLIVDEALSVGDIYFQHKSFQKIKEFREQGTTILVVSHDAAAIQNLCDRAILLENGNIIKDDKPKVVMDFYNALIAEKENTNVEINSLENGEKQTISGTGAAKVEKIQIFNSKNDPVDSLIVGEKTILRIRINILEDIPELVLGYMIKDRLGQPVFGTNTFHTGQVLKNSKLGQSYTFDILFNTNIGIGSYSISTALSSSDTHLKDNFEWKDLALMFNVVRSDQDIFVGGAWIPPQISIKHTTIL